MELREQVLSMVNDANADGGSGQYKYNVESAIVVTCSWLGLMTVSTLSDPKQLEQVPEDCHVYAICTQPRLRLIAADVVNEENGVCTFDITIARSDEYAAVRFGLKTRMQSGTTVKIINDGATANFVSATGEVISTIPTALLLVTGTPPPLHELRPEHVDRDLLDLAVQYVGQAYGKDGSRSALRRLANHETLQKILAELNDRGSHFQVWIIVFRFDEHDAISAIRPQQGMASEDDTYDNLRGIWSTILPGNQMTTLAEGSLIRHFKPPFNERYKEMFPSAEHSLYKLPYKLDAHSVGFQFDTMPIGVRLGSDTVTPSWIHTGLYPLSDPSVRRTFWAFFTDMHQTRQQQSAGADPANIDSE